MTKDLLVILISAIICLILIVIGKLPLGITLIAIALIYLYTKNRKNNIYWDKFKDHFKL